MDGLTLSQISGSIGQLFSVYLFGTDTLGQLLSFLLLLGFIWMMTVKFGVSTDGQILIIGVLGMLVGSMMFGTMMMRPLGILTAIVFAIFILIAVSKLMRR